MEKNRKKFEEIWRKGFFQRSEKGFEKGGKHEKRERRRGKGGDCPICSWTQSRSRPGQHSVRRWLQHPGQVSKFQVDLKYPVFIWSKIYTTYRKSCKCTCANQTKSGIKMQKLKVWVGSYVTAASDKSMHKLHVSSLSVYHVCYTLSIYVMCLLYITLPWVSPAFKTFCISFQHSFLIQAAVISCHLVSSHVIAMSFSLTPEVYGSRARLNFGKSSQPQLERSWYLSSVMESYQIKEEIYNKCFKMFQDVSNCQEAEISLEAKPEFVL